MINRTLQSLVPPRKPILRIGRRHSGEGSKQFFFEKKNQKTFTFGVAYRPRRVVPAAREGK
jgi:hypothetical protein